MNARAPLPDLKQRIPCLLTKQMFVLPHLTSIPWALLCRLCVSVPEKNVSMTSEDRLRCGFLEALESGFS